MVNEVKAIEKREFAKGLKLTIIQAAKDGIAVSRVEAMEYSPGWLLTRVTAFYGEETWYGVDIKAGTAEKR